MKLERVTDLVKIWSPIVFGAVMFYVSFVKLEETVNRLDKVVENLTVITTEVNTAVQIHSETLRNHEIRINKLEDRNN